MKRNLTILLCILAMLSAFLISCEKECEHEFSSNWESNDTGHWHPAICDHGEIKDGYAEHVDSDENSVCDVCGYEGDGLKHVCTFEEEWQSSETHHWHAATCSHKDEKGDYDLHSDVDLNGECDYCTAHVHKMNIIGLCSGCGVRLKEVDDIENLEIAMAIYAISQNHYNVNGGTIDYEFIGRSNSGAEFESTMYKDVEYIFGNGYTYIKESTNTTVGGENTTGLKEAWYEVDGNGVFGVYKEDESDFILDSATENSLLGFYYAVSTFADGHGAENILYNLFEISQDVNSDGFDYTLDDNSASFKFNHNISKVNISNTTGGQVVNVSHFIVEVKFTRTDDYTLTGMDITIDVYTNDPGATSEGILEDDIDFDYDVETGRIVMRDNAKADTYTIKTVQSVGERTAINPNPKSSFVPDSFDVFADADRKIPLGKTMLAELDGIYYIYLGNYQPAGASLNYVFDYITFEVYDGNGNLVEDAETYDSPIFRSFFVFDPTGRHFFFIPKTADTYTYVIYFLGNKTHEVTIYASEDIGNKVQPGENQVAASVTETYATAHDELYFTAKESGTYTFTFTDNLTFINADEYDAAYDKDGALIGEEPTVYYDFQDPLTPKDSIFTVDLAAGETIRFYVSSDKVGTYLIDYSVK